MDQNRIDDKEVLRGLGLEYITIDDHIEFIADRIHIRYQDSELICSLSGEFVKDREPFNPPMEYSMENMGVTTQNPEWILIPIYYYLESQRETKSEDSDKDLTKKLPLRELISKID